MLSPNAIQNHRRYPHFDGLRAFAVLFVMHQHWIYNKYQADTYNNWYHYFLKIPLGELGVTIFFVLSGFLISEILLKSRECTHDEKWRFIRAFYIRRSLRIFPIYFLTISVATHLDLQPFREHFWWLALYATNVLVFLQQKWIASASHLWTLAVEEQFYIFWPMIAVFFIRRFSIMAIIIICGGVATQLVAAVLYQNVKYINILPFVSMDALAIGGLLALRGKVADVIEGISRKSSWVLIVMYVALLAGAEGPIVKLLTHTAAVSTAVHLVSYGSRNSTGLAGRVLGWEPLRFMGVISYGIYLYHNFAGLIASSILRNYGISFYSFNFGVRIAFMIVVTTALAATSWFIIERPINKYKRYFPYVVRVRA